MLMTVVVTFLGTERRLAARFVQASTKLERDSWSHVMAQQMPVGG